MHVICDRYRLPERRPSLYAVLNAFQEPSYEEIQSHLTVKDDIKEKMKSLKDGELFVGSSQSKSEQLITVMTGEHYRYTLNSFGLC